MESTTVALSEERVWRRLGITGEGSYRVEEPSLEISPTCNHIIWRWPFASRAQPETALRHLLGARYLQEDTADIKLAFLRFLWLRVLGFRYGLTLLLDQDCQGFAEWKLLYDRLDNVLQLLFATSKGTFSIGDRKGEVERVETDRVPRQTFFQKPEFVSRQNKKKVANPLSHSTGELIPNQQNSKSPRMGLPSDTRKTLVLLETNCHTAVSAQRADGRRP